jgi:hypothetical protein
VRFPVQLILGLVIFLLGQSTMLPLPGGRNGQTPKPDGKTSSALIRPGLSAGPLRLGDTYERATELFPPKPNIDQEFSQPAGCGRELNWVDLRNPQVGNMFIRFKDGTIFQIDVASTRYHLTEGIAISSSPQEVRKHYQGLHAYILSNITSTEVRPLVYWVDPKKGIAFAFAPYRRKHGRYLSKIIVFKPNSEICPADDSPNSPDKQELAPYSLEPPDSK